MITTNEGVTIEILKLDEWVVRMIITQTCPVQGNCYSATVFTKTQMIEELNNAKPPKRMRRLKGAKKNGHE